MYVIESELCVHKINVNRNYVTRDTHEPWVLFICNSILHIIIYLKTIHLQGTSKFIHNNLKKPKILFSLRYL